MCGDEFTLERRGKGEVKNNCTVKSDWWGNFYTFGRVIWWMTRELIHRYVVKLSQLGLWLVCEYFSPPPPPTVISHEGRDIMAAVGRENHAVFFCSDEPLCNSFSLRLPSFSMHFSRFLSLSISLTGFLTAWWKSCSFEKENLRRCLSSSLLNIETLQTGPRILTLHIPIAEILSAQILVTN